MMKMKGYIPWIVWLGEIRSVLIVLWIGIAGQVPTYAQQTPAATAPKQVRTAIVLGKTEFPINEYFTISFTLQGAALSRYSAFPDIEGFKKSGKSSTTTTRIVGGKTSTELTITQRYAAFEEGEFELEPFTITINGEVTRAEGATLLVG